MERKSLAWAHGHLSVQNLGGMMGPVLFVLPDGKIVKPLHIAPWGSDPNRKTLPKILQELRGEWPCIPFGIDMERELAKDWNTNALDIQFNQHPHGYCSNSHWKWGKCSEKQIELICEYPEEHPIALLSRVISPDPQEPAIDISLEVIARHNCDLPIALHPTFTIPNSPSALELSLGTYNHIRSFPASVEAGAGLFPEDDTFTSLKKVRTCQGDIIDAGILPLNTPCEELLQVIGTQGEVALINHAYGYQSTLQWNSEHFNSLLLWYSNFGRKSYPWNGQHLAIGIEPICSAFDLGPAISKAPNPVSESGYKTAHSFIADEPFSTAYRLSVSNL